MHPVVFSHEWFDLHQSKLLWLLNHWLTRRWFRWVLCIRKHDIGYRLPICELRPDAYTVWLGKNDFATDFRTHHKYAKRLYYAFEPVWFVLHFWDWLVADRFYVPKLSFGFATLTSFPDPSTGATTTDGYSARSGVDETFATIIAGAGNAVDSGTSTSASIPQLRGSTTSNQFQACYRGVFTFKTSVPGTITSVVFSVYGSSAINTALGTPDHHVVGSTKTNYNAIGIADYVKILPETSFGSVANASWNASGYNDHTLNSNGVDAVNPSGISAFMTATSWDINASFGGVWASNATTSFQVNFADQTGSANDPKLVVTYNVAGRFTQGASPTLLGSLTRPAMFKPGRAR